MMGPLPESKGNDMVVVIVDQFTKKLDGKFVGPLVLVEKVGASAYQLRILASWKIYNVFNEILLKPYKKPEFP